MLTARQQPPPNCRRNRRRRRYLGPVRDHPRTHRVRQTQYYSPRLLRQILSNSLEQDVLGSPEEALSNGTALVTGFDHAGGLSHPLVFSDNHPNLTLRSC